MQHRSALRAAERTSWIVVGNEKGGSRVYLRISIRRRFMRQHDVIQFLASRQWFRNLQEKSRAAVQPPM